MKQSANGWDVDDVIVVEGCEDTDGIMLDGNAEKVGETKWWDVSVWWLLLQSIEDELLVEVVVSETLEDVVEGLVVVLCGCHGVEWLRVEGR